MFVTGDDSTRYDRVREENPTDSKDGKYNFWSQLECNETDLTN